jgi:exopolysaccharide biosynthesis predicted pyruvyltransferase EpsI
MIHNSIESFLEGYKGKSIKYLPNPGNAGDALIAASTIHLFRKIGLDFTFFESCGGLFSNDILFYGGGGNLINKYSNCRNFLRNNYKNNEIVVLPHTISDLDRPLSILGDNVTLIAREEVSYDYIKSKMLHPNNALLFDDLAFHVPGIDSYKKTPSFSTGNFYRLDKEKTDILIPSDNLDISNDCNVISPGAKFKSMGDIHDSAHRFVNLISNYKEVNTNRLHVAIAGALLGKKVNMYPNSYYKNKAVFDFSIKDKFKNVSFCPSEC